MHDIASPLTAWANFYVVTGSSAAALTGLMFVVVTLIAGDGSRGRAAPMPASNRADEGLATFSTPTVVHFCAALLVSATLSAPWPALVPAAVMLGLTGLVGVVYGAIVMYRTRRLTVYRPGLDDWIWYTILPFAAYLAIVAAAIGLPLAPVGALFAFAAATMLLIFLGIHNAWDVVTFLAVGQFRQDSGVQPAASADDDSALPAAHGESER